MIGVADSVEHLVGDHRSIERALVQVQMPRMSLEELMEAIDKGAAELGMAITNVARARIARLSEGLPYYTHILCLHAFQRAVTDERREVWAGDIQSAVELSVQKAQQHPQRVSARDAESAEGRSAKS